MNNLQTKKTLKTQEVAVIVKQFVAFLDAECGDQAINSLAYGDPAPLEHPKVLRSLEGETRRHTFKNRERQKLFLRPPKFLIGTEAAQDLA